MQSPKITALRMIEGSQLSVTPQLSAEPPPSCTAAPLRGPATTPTKRGLPDRLQPRQVAGEGVRTSTVHPGRAGKKKVVETGTDEKKKGIQKMISDVDPAAGSW